MLDRKRFHAWFDNVFLGGYKYHPKLKWTEEAMRERRVLNAGATMYFLSELDEQLGAIKETVKKALRGGLGQVSAGEVRHVLGNLPLLAAADVAVQGGAPAWNPGVLG